MDRLVPGVYRNGKVELLEPAPTTAETPVVVSFPENGKSAELASRGLTPEQAADLRRRLGAFVDDWDRGDMDVYDAL
ncbi:MAG TPA: hypothetical protein VJZ71_20990 [Phycisphaerae bacterium]|nr:hypothetical protein [Phycisphaerae bacterium]